MAEVRKNVLKVMSAYGYTFVGEESDGHLKFDFGGGFTTFTGWDELNSFVNGFILAC